MLSLKVRTPTGVLSLSISEDSTFEQLKIEIAEKGNIDNDFDVLAGFPLRPLTLNDEDSIRGIISNNEVLRIQAKELAGQQSQGHSKYRPSKKSKGASASSLQTSSSPPKSKLIKSNNDSSGSGFGAKIATIQTTTSSNRNNNSSSSRKSSRSSGFTVFAPGGIRSGTPSQRSANRIRQATRKPRTSNLANDQPNNGTTESDISEHLINAVSGGSTKRDKILRKVFRNAVEYQYSSSKAVARLQAVYGGNYSITPSSTAKVLGSGMSTQLDITYPRGPGQRTFFTETVELLGEELLKALMKVAVEDTEGEGREVLKPMNLARCSPRIFWSIVHRYGANLVSSIRHLLTGVDDDCLWLTERKRDLSEKAKENAEQERQRLALREMRKRKLHPNDSSAEEVFTAAKDNNNHSSTIVPSDGLLDANNSSNTSSSSSEKKRLSPRLCKLFASLSLTLCLPPDETVLAAVKKILLNKFREHLSEESLSSTIPWVLLLANVNEIHSFHQQFLAEVPSSSILEEEMDLWVASAQHFALQHLWQVVCGNGSERLRQALASLRVRTPVEMLLWRAVPGGLYSGLNQSDAGLQSMLFSWNEETTAGTKERWSVAHVQFMVSLCQEVVEWCRAWIYSYDRIVAEDDSTKENEADDEKNADQEQEGDESVSFEEWVRDASANELIGRRCRIVVRSSDDLDDGGSKEIEEETANEEVGSYWEDGTVIAYLPATEEEPEELWRVELDEKPAKSSSSSAQNGKAQVRYEDLEEQEVKTGLQRYSTALSMI